MDRKLLALSLTKTRKEKRPRRLYLIVLGLIVICFYLVKTLGLV